MCNDAVCLCIDKVMLVETKKYNMFCEHGPRVTERLIRGVDM